MSSKVVWEYFENSESFWQPNLKHCNKKCSVQKTGTLSHRWTHLERDHRAQGQIITEAIEARASGP